MGAESSFIFRECLGSVQKLSGNECDIIFERLRLNTRAKYHVTENLQPGKLRAMI